MHVHSFEPIYKPNARLLILGTVPGKESLRRNQYYGSDRNAFWRLMSDVLSLDSELSYRERCASLQHKGVAVWDVLKRCTRSSSLDSSIVDPVPNDLEDIFNSSSNIRSVFFNGTKAEKLFQRYFSSLAERYECIRLPSTSPAYASMPYSEKLKFWSVIRDAGV